MKFFDLDSPLMQGLNKVADLMFLNLLTLLCCVPVVTAGASFTALHYVALKIVRNEECYIARDFFKSFRRNLRQGTIIWLLMLFLALVLWGDFIILRHADLEFAGVLRTILTGIGIVMLFTSMFLFPVLAKFDDTVLRTFKNAFFTSALQFPKTILMMIMFAVPPVLFFALPHIIPLIFLFGFSVPAWLSAMLYNKFFLRLEEQILVRNPGAVTETDPEKDDDRIFKDELEECLREDPR
mgnify:CR=1 FL=1